MNSELLLVVVPSFVALLVAVLGIFQDSVRLRLWTSLEAAIRDGRAICRDGENPGSVRRFSDEKLLLSGWSSKLRKVRRVESECLADTSGEV